MVSTKKALRLLWKDRLTVTGYKEVQKPNKSTGFEEVPVLEDVPCKLSFSSLPAANQGDQTATAMQVIKVFLDENVVIKPGSKITVTRRDQVYEFAQSGLPGVFTNHQEITLVPFEGWT